MPAWLIDTVDMVAGMESWPTAPVVAAGVTPGAGLLKPLMPMAPAGVSGEGVVLPGTPPTPMPGPAGTKPGPAVGTMPLLPPPPGVAMPLLPGGVTRPAGAIGVVGVVVGVVGVAGTPGGLMPPAAGCCTPPGVVGGVVGTAGGGTTLATRGTAVAAPGTAAVGGVVTAAGVVAVGTVGRGAAAGIPEGTAVAVAPPAAGTPAGGLICACAAPAVFVALRAFCVEGGIGDRTEHRTSSDMRRGGEEGE